MISRISLLAALLLLLVGAGRAGAQGRGELEIDTITTDFGGVTTGSCHTLSVVVRNLSSVQMDTVIIRSSDTQTITVLTPLLLNLNPGSSDSVQIRWCPASPLCLDTLPRPVFLIATGSDSLSSFDSIAYVDSVQVEGCAADSTLPDILTISDTLLSFGGIRLPNCVDDTITINYRGQPRSMNLNLAPSGRFIIVSPQNTRQIPLRGDDTLDVVVRFCPDTLGLHSATLSITADSLPGGTVQLAGVGLPAWDLPSAIDFGTVDTGVCRDTVFNNVRALGGLALQLTDTTIGPFTLDFRDSILLPGVSGSVTITFCPGDSIAYVGDVIAYDNAVGRAYAWLRLTGRGRTLPTDTTSPQNHLLWIDTATARVGQLTGLTIQTTPPLAFSDLTDTLRLVVGYPRSSLVLESVESVAPGWNVGFRDAGDSSALLTLMPDRLAGPASTLARIGFTGLTTGVPVNGVTVQVESGLGGTITTRDGLLLLEGCALGVDPRMSRRAAINGLRLEPGGGTLLLDYRAPLNARVTVRISDVAGTGVRTIELPAGSDAEATAQIPLDGVAPGLAVVELRAGDARAVTLVMVR